MTIPPTCGARTHSWRRNRAIRRFRSSPFGSLRRCVRARSGGGGGIPGQTHRSRVRSRAVFRLAAAFSSAGLVSGFSASAAAAAIFTGRAMAARSGLSCPDRLRPPHHAEQRKRASRLPEVLSGFGNDVSVVRFATQPAPDLLTANPSDVLAQYGLPRKYFYLPNQFWRHKNHQVVVDALTILKKRGVDVVVAASGSAEDPREPDYFDGLMRKSRDRGLEMNFRYLGMIPLEHVYALLRSSTALINPSCFEGWSTTVEEAKSFGVPMIFPISMFTANRPAAPRAISARRSRDPRGSSFGRFASRQPPAVRDLLPDLDRRVGAFAAEFVRAVRGAML